MPTTTYYATKDAHMGKELSGTFSGWNGTENHLQVGASPSYKWRSVVAFNIDFSVMTAITSATLYLVDSAAHASHAEQDTPPSTLKVARMTKDWGEGSAEPGEGDMTGTLTWHWDNRYDQFTNTGANTKSITQTPGSDTSIDVTDIVTAWFNGHANYGFMLINNTSESNSDKALLFYSRQKGGTDRPRLSITYTTNTAPTAPTLSSPSDASTITTLTPTLSGTSNDADTGDYITAVQIQVYNNSSSALMWDTGTLTQSGGITSFSIPYGSSSSSVYYEPLASGVTYKWRVRTRDRALEWGAYSSYYTFTTNTPPNQPTVTVAPTPLSDVADDTPDITVTHVDSDPLDSLMDGYQIVVDSSDGSTWTQFWDSGNIDISGSPSATATASPSALAWGTLHRARARTQDSGGAWSQFSNNLEFTTHAAGAPTSLSPSGSESVSASPHLVGVRASITDNIEDYEIYVYSDDLNTTMWNSGVLTTGITNGSQFSKLYAGSALSAGAYYQWKARVTSTIGGTSIWSDLQRFRVVPATVPTLSSPVGSGVSDLTPTLTGSTAGSFNRMQIELYPSTATSAVLGSSLWASGTLSATIGAGGLGTEFTYAYPGSPALTSNTTYKWRARVSTDAGSTWSDWSGLTSFTTAVADTPTLTSVGGTSYPTFPWITDSTPDLVVTRGASTNIAKTYIMVYNESATATLWDSGWQDHVDGTSSTTTYAGTTLVPGTTYSWKAKVEDINGLVSEWTALSQFRLNGPPLVPTDLSPAPGYTFSNTLFATFEATFEDSDKTAFSDYPTEWEIMIDDNGAQTSINITTSLLSGKNVYTMDGGDVALSYDTLYLWRSRYKDSKSEWGEWSGWQSFFCGQPPNGTITVPSDGSTISTSSPYIQWTYSGGTQQSFTIDIDRTDSGGTKVADVWNTTVVSANHYYTIPAGHMANTKFYDITLTVTNTSDLDDPSPSTVNVELQQDAPDAVTTVVATADDDWSKIIVTWDQTTLKVGHTFVSYNIYRRIVGDTEWTLIGNTYAITTNEYDDWYAGHGLNYDYRVTTSTTKSGVELESPDATSPDSSIAYRVTLSSDVWMLVGSDRAANHVQELPVMESSHNRPVQQESFEVLGSNRKVIIRGYVLGHEGSITCIWDKREVASPSDSQVMYDYTIIGRRLVEYLTYVKGPHILKSPFGDVWEVEFSSPSYQWMGGGHLQVSLEWVETGNTSQEGVL